MSEENVDAGEFPKMLYREGSEIVWDGQSVDTLTVEDAAEEADAVKAGWSHKVKKPAAKRPAAEK